MKTISFVTPFFNSFRCNSIASKFDLQPGEERVNTITFNEPPEPSDDWQIGLIVGPSGAGKTTVARALYGDSVFQGHAWDERPIIENFDESLSVDDVSRALVSVGLGSIPTWLQAYKTLSNGEKFRCDLARAVVEHKSPLLVYDEYTSVVDRTVAKTCSMALKRLYTTDEKLSDKKFVALSCHYDIAEYLQPDWILDMQTGEVNRRRLRRPPINVDVRRCDKVLWNVFKKYHYLTGKLPVIARCYAALIDDLPAGFFATVHSIGHKGYRRGSRIVVLPDYQGVGLGTRLATYIADYETRLFGLKSFTITSSNGYFLKSLLKSGRWRFLERDVSQSTSSKERAHYIKSFGKINVTVRYCGGKPKKE